MPSSRRVRMPRSRARWRIAATLDTLVDHAADFVVEHADFEDAHAALAAGAATFVAAAALAEIRLLELIGLEVERAHFNLGRLVGLGAIRHKCAGRAAVP